MKSLRHTADSNERNVYIHAVPLSPHKKPKSLLHRWYGKAEVSNDLTNKPSSAVSGLNRSRGNSFVERGEVIIEISMYFKSMRHFELKGYQLHSKFKIYILLTTTVSILFYDSRENIAVDRKHRHTSIVALPNCSK